MEKRSDAVQMTIIGAGTTIEGTLVSPHTVRIDGTLKGTKLESSDTVSIGEGGLVEADVRARNALICGKVIGNLVVEERIELASHASVAGDLKTKSLVINEGATFQGRSEMSGGQRVSA
jgi:cytoskeletal protein CcmA (bactofilin family)